MSPNSIMVILMSLGSAGVFLALIIGMGDKDAGEMVASVANMTPAARRRAQFDQLDEMTRAADAAIEARKLGKRAPFQHDEY
jgi:hypothetical protein